jgi:hypothetical protein
MILLVANVFSVAVGPEVRKVTGESTVRSWYDAARGSRQCKSRTILGDRLVEESIQYP